MPSYRDSLRGTSAWRDLPKKLKEAGQEREALLLQRQGIINAMGCGWTGYRNIRRLAEIDRLLKEGGG